MDYLTYAGKSAAVRRRKKLPGLEPEQGPLPESRVHQGAGDRLLHPHRAGVASAFARSPAHNEALPERCRSAVLLREELPGPSAELGEDGEGLERRQPARHAVLPRPGFTDARL